MLDPVSLYFSSVLVSTTAGTVTYLFGRKYPEFRSVKDWGLATLLIALGTALVIARGIWNSDFIILISNTILVSGIVLTYRSFRVYRRESLKDVFGIGLICTAFAVTVLWQLGYVPERLRGAVITGLFALVMWRIVWLFITQPLQHAKIAQRALVVTYFAYALLNSFRTGAAFIGSTNGVLDPTLIEVIYILGNTILWISVTLCVIWMVIERQHGELKEMALVDPLTRAMNRNALINAFDKEHSRASRNGTTFALLLLDVDFFKQFNDNHGHLVGDQVLKNIVSTLKPTVRQNDSIGRYGGEEFVILLSDVDKSIALKVAERARKKFEENGVDVNGQNLALTISVGVAIYPVHGNSWDELIAEADRALYEAKRNGRNQVVYAGDLQEPSAEDSTANQVVPVPV
jgi:diguanylate cyclase (GGDEF)-like protein